MPNDEYVHLNDANNLTERRAARRDLNIAAGDFNQIPQFDWIEIIIVHVFQLQLSLAEYAMYLGTQSITRTYGFGGWGTLRDRNFPRLCEVLYDGYGADVIFISTFNELYSEHWTLSWPHNHVHVCPFLSHKSLIKSNRICSMGSFMSETKLSSFLNSTNFNLLQLVGYVLQSTPTVHTHTYTISGSSIESWISKQ